MPPLLSAENDSAAGCRRYFLRKMIRRRDAAVTFCGIYFGAFGERAPPHPNGRVGDPSHIVMLNRQVGRPVLPSDTKVFDDLEVAVVFRAFEVIEEFAAVVDHRDETAAGVVILGVGLEMLGEVFDAFGENGDLNVGGAGVLGVELVLGADGACVDLTHFFSW